jgi:hypothetical protein
MSLEILITLAGLIVAGLAAILGMWMERDKNKPPRYAYSLSILILLATAVGMFQTYMDAKEAEKMEGDMARMLAMLEQIQSNSECEIPELQELVKTEVASQSRSNPRLVQKFAQRVADEGGDPQAILAKSLPPGDVENLSRKGALKLKPPSAPAPAAANGSAGAEVRPRLGFGRKRDAAATATAVPTAAPIDKPASTGTAEAKDAADAGAPPADAGAKPGIKLPGAGTAAPTATAAPKPAGGLKAPVKK